MTWLPEIAMVVFGFLVFDLMVYLVLLLLKKRFQWLVFSSDQFPEDNKDKIDQYFNNSFDPLLGWVPRPNTSGQDKTISGMVKFCINSSGARGNPKYDGGPSTCSVFGDSYAFCRMVEDTETWPYYLSEELASNVPNYGVGNYGLDQAVLRFERELSNLDSKYIIIGIVPETIVRIQSYWKHYFEYGNKMAFKPIFKLDNSKLDLIPPIVNGKEMYSSLKNNLNTIKSLDRFYSGKFIKDCLNFPFSLSLILTWRYNLVIVWRLLLGLFHVQENNSYKQAFQHVYSRNAKITSSLYLENKSKEIFRRIVERFVNVCEAKSRVPILVIIPQPVDLEVVESDQDNLAEFFSSLKNIIKVVDLTPTFLAHPNRSALFVEGERGPHPSPKANMLIANEIKRFIEEKAKIC